MLDCYCAQTCDICNKLNEMKYTYANCGIVLQGPSSVGVRKKKNMSALAINRAVNKAAKAAQQAQAQAGHKINF